MENNGVKQDNTFTIVNDDRKLNVRFYSLMKMKKQRRII